ncbi:tRNA uridine-5-carboxymethylaminomethyl(34) synthesis GTPase MnmE [Porphyromonas sp.]|uniref:tRNA uridine-5-carboxymethylaminomethyl(34) synthesis GTPase MnmE n=1 Tax=Porphyromonas sp. TaxID=1924944 RepID=UPI0026DB9F24|nr:tRNA uridine-5-carboxymethylaminomethyl(34) synthesis GTPase MnmE [Porphyromonas sp.]MDO4695829.1 tRNA uridine-5-carboxymethylaminomethyl(34) synthesis GTPase MnmE [Porphyromonas sp.]MDO4771014.1 tRNA uridine-5-carboxymethylaminomethyl(34) synthesis GTPase MnmE [Porphyromonas sp.]
MSLYSINETICALGTPMGRAAIGVIKMSGAHAFEILKKVFRPLVKKEYDPLSQHVTYGWIIDPTNEEHIDDVVVVTYVNPKSYTGEDMVEISCHGSPYILSEVMKLLVSSGARPAEGGEFTKRAFANGKMDLSQAEAVADVIASTNKAALRMSMNQMRGHFSRKIEALRETLIRFCSLLELELDFSEEDVEFADRKALTDSCTSILEELKELSGSFEKGRVIKNGIPIAIAGATNAGKSTLLNALLEEDRAIVSDIHGTTRDAIEDTVILGGREFRFIDTAGIRHTDDPIESIGINKSFEKINQASLTLWMIDASDNGLDLNSLLDDIIKHATKDNICALINKKDIVDPLRIEEMTQALKQLGISNVIPMSAKDQQDIAKVKQQILQHFEDLNVGENDIIVSNLRHVTVIQEASGHLQTVLNGLSLNIPGDLLSQDLRAAINLLGEVVGNVSSDDILHSIFKNFCIGK